MLMSSTSSRSAIHPSDDTEIPTMAPYSELKLSMSSEDDSGPAVLDAASKVTEDTTPSTSFSSATSGSISTPTRDRSLSDVTPISPRRPARRTRVQSMNEGSVGSQEFFRTSSTGSASGCSPLTRPRRTRVSSMNQGSKGAHDFFGATVTVGDDAPVSDGIDPSYCRLNSCGLDSTMVSERQEDEGEDEDLAPAIDEPATEKKQAEQVTPHPSQTEQTKTSQQNEILTKTTSPSVQDVKPDEKMTNAPPSAGVDAGCSCIIL